MTHVRENVVAYIALFFAMTGAAFAAADPLLDKKDSVDSSNLARGAVHTRALDANAVNGKKLGEEVQAQVGLGTPPGNGNTGFITTDATSSSTTDPITVSATFNGQDQLLSVETNSADAACTFGHGGGQISYLGPSEWNFFDSEGSTTIDAFVNYGNATQVYLKGAVITDGSTQCRIDPTYLNAIN